MTKFAGAVALLLLAAVVNGSQFPPSLVKEARRAAVVNPELRHAAVQRKAAFNQKIRSLAKPFRRQLDQYNNNNNNNGYQNNNNNNGQNQQNNYYGQNQNNNAYNGQQYNMQQNWMDDYEWDQIWQSGGYNWDANMNEGEFGFEISDYAIKFQQCATVETFSDELAEDQEVETVLSAERFAVFRLCPAEQCSSYTKTGCGSNYGEYAVSLDQYLLAILEEEEERVVNYCGYCQNCANIQASKYFWQELETRREAALQSAEENYQEWYQNYVQNYAQQQNEYQQQNMYNQYGGQDQEQAQDYELGQRYYNYVKDRSNYANNYYNANYGGNYNGYNQNQNQNQDDEVSWDNKWTQQDFWKFQDSYEKNYNNQNAWQTMGNGFATFYGKPVINGYYDQNGDFIEQWGFFNSYGYYVSLEEEGNVQWDTNMFGELPDGWASTSEYVEPCNVDYAAACYNQYDACMTIMDNQDYYAANQGYESGYGYMNNADSYVYENGYTYEEYAQQVQEEYEQAQYYEMYNETEEAQEYFKEQSRRRHNSLKNFMECTEVSYFANNDEANQDYYQQQYYEKQQYIKEQYNCYDGDEDCEYAREQAIEKYNYELQQDQARQFFVGPHCSSDGRKITLAVYKDEFCTIMDYDNAVEDLLGYDPVEDVDLVPDECITCGVPEESLEYYQWYEDEQGDFIDVEPMCSMLYQLSAKCNKNLNADVSAFEYRYNQNYDADQDWNQMYQSQEQQRNEEAVCNWITSLKSNNYDENGQVVLTNDAWRHPNMWSSEFAAERAAMSPGMKAAISLLTLATAVMGVWACFLHGTLARKNIPWRPRYNGSLTGKAEPYDPTDIARQNSGIVMGRSRSGPGSNPLI